MNIFAIVLVAVVALGGVTGSEANGKESVQKCLKEMEEALEGFEVPAEVSKLGETIRAANPEWKDVSLGKLVNGRLTNPTAKLIVRDQLASEEEWNHLVTVCHKFYHEFEERREKAPCAKDLFKMMPTFDELNDIFDTNEEVSRINAYDTACRIQWVAAKGEECLVSANKEMVGLEVPEDVVKLGQDLRAMNPELSGLNLYELTDHQNVKSNVKEFTKAEDDDWFNLIQHCRYLWGKYTVRTRNAECGDDIWHVTNPSYNQDITRMLSVAPELDHVASHIYACTEHVREWQEAAAERRAAWTTTTKKPSTLSRVKNCFTGRCD